MKWKRLSFCFWPLWKNQLQIWTKVCTLALCIAHYTCIKFFIDLRSHVAHMYMIHTINSSMTDESISKRTIQLKFWKEIKRIYWKLLQNYIVYTKTNKIKYSIHNKNNPFFVDFFYWKCLKFGGRPPSPLRCYVPKPINNPWLRKKGFTSHGEQCTTCNL